MNDQDHAFQGLKETCESLLRALHAIHDVTRELKAQMDVLKIRIATLEARTHGEDAENALN
jgi:hypothetical protein